MDWTLAIPILAGGVRNVIGFVENGLKDGKLDKYEWGELIKTILTVSVLAFSAVYGLGLDTVQASGLAVLASYLLSAIKKRK